MDKDEEIVTPPLLRVRMVDLQINMTPPAASLLHAYQPPLTGATSFPSGTLPRRIPLIRIFGTTPLNQKVCINVHGIWPYLFVEYPATGDLDPDTVHKFTHRMAVSLNAAICSSLRQNPFANGRSGGGINTAQLHVASVTLVKGIPFYGYRVGYSYFLKISLVTPSHIYRAVGLLEGGSVMGRKFAVYESHLATKLQFMIDYDLYGCGWVDIDGGKFREDLPEGDPMSDPEDQDGLINTVTVAPLNLYTPGESPPKDTWCSIEIDVLPWQILNRRRLQPRYLHESLRELLHPETIDPNEKLVRAVRELWEEENRRRITKGLSELDLSGQGGIDGADEIDRVTPSQDDPKWAGGDWGSVSERYQEILEERMVRERGAKGYRKGRLETMGEPGQAHGHAKFDRYIMTTFESAEAGWPKYVDTPTRRTILRRTQKPPKTSASAPPSGPTQTGAPSSPAESNADEDPFARNPLSQRPLPKELDNGEEDEMVEFDEDVVIKWERSEDHREVMQNEMEAEREMQGYRTAIDYTPTKGGRKRHDDEDDLYEDWVDTAELEEVSASFLEKESKKMSVRAASQQTPVKGTPGNLRARFSSATPGSAGPSVYGLNSFQHSGNRSPYNPYLPVSIIKSPGSATKGNNISPFKISPTNPFSRTNSRPPVTPTKLRTVAGGQSIKSPLLPRLGRSLSKESQAEVDDEDESPAPKFELKQKVEPQSELVGSGEVGASSDTDNGFTVPLAQPVKIEDFTLSVDSSSASSGKKRGHSAVEDNDPLLLPTLKGSAADELQPTLANSGNQKASSLASTLTSSNEAAKPRKRARIADVEEPSPPPSSASKLPLLPKSSESLGSTTTSNVSVPVELLAPGSWRYQPRSPTRQEAVTSLREAGLPDVIYREPFFSRPQDIGKGPVQYGTKMYFVKGDSIAELVEFDFGEADSGTAQVVDGSRLKSLSCDWAYTPVPPTPKSVAAWCRRDADEIKTALDLKSKLASQANPFAAPLYPVHPELTLRGLQFGGPTQKNRYGFATTQKKKNSNTQRESGNMTCMSLEVFAQSQGDRLPDPEKDALVAIFYCFQDEDFYVPGIPEYPGKPGYHAGFLMLRNKHLDVRRIGNHSELKIEVFDSELDLINETINLVKVLDPDVLAGWEVHTSSWGYLVERAGHEFGFALTDDLARVRSTSSGPRNDQYAARHSSALKVVGRHVFNIWRILRGELTLLQYSFENVAFHLLHRRVERYSSKTLTELYKSKIPESGFRLIDYFIKRVVMYLEMMDAAEIVTKNAEFARVFGVDFNSVMSRGSQFKVESFMFRIAKPESFVLVSPSREAVGKQNAAEAQPLIFEPKSYFYNDPIVVLDFQSLYPSIMIGYNYCYSTMLGRVETFNGSYKMGWTEQAMRPGALELLKEHITVSPNGIIYAKQRLRKSLLAKMLGEILATRVMVKQGMKLSKSDKGLLQVLNARQLGLKLMANVTYGYTGASFSGRMPCVEIADSIVQTGRATLEKAIDFISLPENFAKWGATVVYGDTDSLFVHMPGRTREDAHRIGNEIADAVTRRNPKPVKLKFEKVYSASLLMAKKRYVGFKHESIDDREPVFDAKGIETIRRDGFPAQQKMVETCIKMLFRNPDISPIKAYCQSQWLKLRSGHVSPQDFIIAKEVKLGSYSDKVPPPPGVMVATRRLTLDPRAEAEYGERVGYVIVAGEGRRLVDRAVGVEEMLKNRELKLDWDYYITHLLIPPLNRIFKLIGVDVGVWYAEMPKVNVASDQFRSIAAAAAGEGEGEEGGESRRGKRKARSKGKEKVKEEVEVVPRGAGWKVTLDAHFKSVHCLVCGGRMGEDDKDICDECKSNLPSTIHTLLSRLHLAESRLISAHQICASCSSTPLAAEIRCESVDCSVLYARVKAGWGWEDVRGIPGLVRRLEEEAAGAESARAEVGLDAKVENGDDGVIELLSDDDGGRDDGDDGDGDDGAAVTDW